MTGKGFLKFSSFFMMIWGILNIIAGVSMIAGFSFAPGVTGTVKEELILLAFATFVIVGLFEIVASVLGFKAAEDASKAKICMILSAIAILIHVAIIFLGDTSNLDWLSLLASELIPIFYFVGATIRLTTAKKAK